MYTLRSVLNTSKCTNDTLRYHIAQPTCIYYHYYGHILFIYSLFTHFTHDSARYAVWRRQLAYNDLKESILALDTILHKASEMKMNGKRN